MAFTQADIDALDAAYRTGASKVRTADGKEITYRSVAEYERLRARMAADVAASAGTSPGRYFNFEITKGF